MVAQISEQPQRRSVSFPAAVDGPKILTHVQQRSGEEAQHLHAELRKDSKDTCRTLALVLALALAQVHTAAFVWRENVQHWRTSGRAGIISQPQTLTFADPLVWVFSARV